MSAYLRLFGGLRLDAPDLASSARALQRKRLALLALLGASARRVSRDKLTAYLWPESDAERARHQLASSVYELRKAFGEEVILSAADDLWLNSKFVISDVQEFDAALSAGDREEAVALYAGPFLDGFYVAEAPEFERWVDTERTRLAQSYAGALEQIALEKEQRGDRVGAVEVWRKLALQEPYSSRIALRLIHALQAVGDRAAALQHARAHALRVREELGVEPDAQIAASVDEMRDAPEAASPNAQRTHAVIPLEAVPEPRQRTPQPALRRRWGRRMPAILVTIAMVALITYITGGRHWPWMGGRPVVVMMDSPNAARVYDEDAAEASGTNADIINDLLSDLPIQRVKETAGPFWHRHEEIRSLEPDLVLIHLSAFCAEECEPKRVRMRQFIEYLAETDTEFLIYSRFPPDTLPLLLNEMLDDLPRQKPGIEGRIHTFSLVQHGRPHWRDPATGAALKLRVREVLNLR